MLNDLGTALDGQGQFDEAEEAVMEGLEVARLNKNLPEIDEYLAIIQCNLAEINSHQGRPISVCVCECVCVCVCACVRACVQ